MMGRYWLWVVLPAVLVAAAGCSRDETPPPPRTPQVYTTFYPTAYFTRRIAGDLVEVYCPLPPGADPISWMPDGETIGAYQQADLIVTNGANLEQWIPKVSLPPSRMVVTAERLKLTKYDKVFPHSHVGGGEHSHEDIDGHTWLDPTNAKAQAEEIRKALARLLPDHAEQLQSNYDALATNLDELDAAMKGLSTALAGKVIVCSHPAYNYLARGQGWEIINLDLDGRRELSDKAISETEAALAGRTARVILWERPPAAAVAEQLLRRFRLHSVVFSPCETPPAKGTGSGLDYLEVMQHNVERLRSALSD